MDGFNKPRLGSRTILATINFPKLSTLSGTPAFFKNLFRMASLLACFAFNLPFIIGPFARCFQNHKSCFFRIRQGSVFGPALFSRFINDFPAPLSSFVSSFLYADGLTIRSSSLSVPAVVEATQGTLTRMEHWSEYGCFLLNPSKCQVSFFSLDSLLANHQPHLLLFNSSLCFNPSQTFLGITFDCTFLFLNVYLR